MEFPQKDVVLPVLRFHFNVGIRLSVRILAWLWRRMEEGASVVIVSHSIRPFCNGVSRAETIQDGLVCLFENLPVDNAQRINMLENLAQGVIPQ